MNKSRRDNSDAPESQSLDKFDNFWIDLNETTAMHPVAKAQIYSVKWKLTSKSSRLINLKELVEKEEEKVKSPKSAK